MLNMIMLNFQKKKIFLIIPDKVFFSLYAILLFYELISAFVRILDLNCQFGFEDVKGRVSAKTNF